MGKTKGWRDGGTEGQRDRNNFISPSLWLFVSLSLSLPLPIPRLRSVDDGEHRGFIQTAEPALAFLIIDDGGEKVRSAEIRPQRVSHINLRICDLPQKKIAHAHLAAGADQQVGIGQTGGVKVARDLVFGERFGRAAFALELLHQLAEGV